MGDPRNLRSQQVLLLAEEERIANDVAFQITREQYLDLARRLYVRRRQIWKAFPWAKRAIGHEVGVFVDASALLFLVLFFLLGSGLFSFSLTRFLSAFSCGLNDIVVGLGASNLSKES